MKPENWKTQLKKLKLDYIKKTSPGFFELSGGYEMKVSPWNDKTANSLTKSIEDWITYSGYYVNRISTTGLIRTIRGKQVWTKGNTNKGAADLRIVVNGKSADIEIKIGNDRQSEEQKKEQKRIEQAGGYYFIAKDFPSFLEWYNQTFKSTTHDNHQILLTKTS